MRTVARSGGFCRNLGARMIYGYSGKHAPTFGSCSADSRLGFAQSPPPDELVVSRNVMVPMRDGARLATDIYRPARNGIPAAGKFPVILERTPYNKDDSGYLTEFVRSGYIAIAQDTRGPGTTPLKLVPDYEVWLVEAMSTGDLNGLFR